MQKQVEITRELQLDELRKLANVTAPCITVMFTLPSATGQNRTDLQALRPATRQVQQILEDQWSDLPKSQRMELVESLGDIDAEAPEWQDRRGGTLVVLRSPDVFRAFHLPEHNTGEARVTVGESFHLLPILQSLNMRSQAFYLLALSQKHVRLLHCTREFSSEIEFPDNVPTNLESYLNTRLPNESPRPIDSSSQERGSTAGTFNSTHDRDNKDQFIAHFFRQIDNAVFELLRGKDKPLVLCGVDREQAMYRDLNSYPNLWKDGVQGSPEGFKGGEMHARALDAVQEYYARPAQKAIEIWNDIAGTNRVSTSFPDIVKAAFESRISHLFVKQGAQTMGVFDRPTMEMKVQGRQEDLVNAAALQTLASGGEVFVMPAEQVPGGQQMSAILRF